MKEISILYKFNTYLRVTCCTQEPSIRPFFNFILTIQYLYWYYLVYDKGTHPRVEARLNKTL